MRLTYRITKATNTHSEYVRLDVFHCNSGYVNVAPTRGMLYVHRPSCFNSNFTSSVNTTASGFRRVDERHALCLYFSKKVTSTKQATAPFYGSLSYNVIKVLSQTILIPNLLWMLSVTRSKKKRAKHANYFAVKFISPYLYLYSSLCLSTR